jgi:enoyl-CoA hydratase
LNKKGFETLIYLKHDDYVEIRFNRPHRLNAVIEKFYEELLDALRLSESDANVRVVLLTGEGRAFCVGADMKEHSTAERSLYQRRQYLQLGNNVCEKIFRLSKPVVSVVNGYALGAGAEIAVSCDFVLMDKAAQIGFPEVSIGSCVGGGVTRSLPALVGMAKARQLIFMGSRIDGVEAERIGLVTEAVDGALLHQRAKKLVAELASKAPIAMGLVKKLLNNSSNLDIDAQLQLELDAVYTCTTTADWQEGVDAFIENRSPIFKGN